MPCSLSHQLFLPVPSRSGVFAGHNGQKRCGRAAAGRRGCAGALGGVERARGGVNGLGALLLGAGTGCCAAAVPGCVAAAFQVRVPSALVGK